MIRYLKIAAPLARFAPLSAGTFVPTLPTIPYSAAYGLLMNLAGEDLWNEANPHAWPRLRLAIGVPRREPLPRSLLLHHLHVETVGNSGEVGRGRARGTKPWITPGRVEYLSGFAATLVIEADPALLARVDRGLAGTGLWCGPFAGDSNLIYESCEWTGCPSVHYYVPLRPGDEVVRGSCRLPVYIDRRDQSRCRGVLVAPAAERARDPPAAAWVELPGCEAAPAGRRRGR